MAGQIQIRQLDGCNHDLQLRVTSSRFYCHQVTPVFARRLSSLSREKEPVGLLKITQHLNYNELAAVQNVAAGPGSRQRVHD